MNYKTNLNYLKTLAKLNLVKPQFYKHKLKLSKTKYKRKRQKFKNLNQKNQILNKI